MTAIDLTAPAKEMTGSGPMVSVIVVVKNGEDYLAAALQSIFDQDYRHWEILVVDGRSTDNTAKIAASYPAIRYIRQTDDGLANARNTGIRAARGDLIAFLDHDDLWAPAKLRRQVEYLEHNIEILYTITHVRFFLQQGHPLRSGFKKGDFESERVGCTPSTLVARRRAFEVIGEFNPELAIACDADWFARARDGGLPATVIPEALVYKRIHTANTSANVSTNRKELLGVIQKSVERKREMYGHGGPSSRNGDTV